MKRDFLQWRYYAFTREERAATGLLEIFKRFKIIKDYEIVDYQGMDFVEITYE